MKYIGTVIDMFKDFVAVMDESIPINIRVVKSTLKGTS